MRCLIGIICSFPSSRERNLCYLQAKEYMLCHRLWSASTATGRTVETFKLKGIYPFTFRNNTSVINIPCKQLFYIRDISFIIMSIRYVNTYQLRPKHSSRFIYFIYNKFHSFFDFFLVKVKHNCEVHQEDYNFEKFWKNHFNIFRRIQL